MAIDETAKLSNIIGSIRKFLFDNLTTTENISVYFDQRIDVRRRENEEKWFEVFVFDNNLEELQFQEIRITCATINDSGSENLYNLRDTLLKYLRDPDSITGFKIRRIPIHTIIGSGSSRSAGDIISYATIVKLRAGMQGEVQDQTRILPITVTIFLETKL